MKLFTKIFFTGNLRGASAVIWNFFLYNLQVEKSVAYRISTVMKRAGFKQIFLSLKTC
mgnify:CR=1 FL=1